MNAHNSEYVEANRAYWDKAAPLHRESYDAASLAADPAGLSSGAQEDARLLAPFVPSVAGLDMIHLQCHIGTDTLSWARLGARMTGLDMSEQSLVVARELSAAAGVEIDYVQSTIADAADVLCGRTFDVVYTSIGVLNWLDDLGEWARLIAGLLRPGGVFFVRETHPMALALDEHTPVGDLRLGWPYFNCGPIVDESEEDYSADVPIPGNTYDWAHSLAEIIGSLLKAGLTILDFQEHQTLPWKPLPWLEQVGDDEAPSPGQAGDYWLPEPLRTMCPLAFSLVARK